METGHHSVSNKLHDYLISVNNKKSQTKNIINNRLKWDGSCLGIGVIISTWVKDGINYHSINISQGMIYCTIKRSDDVFPCIVEDIKHVFCIVKRGLHRIILSDQQYIIYYVPISNFGDVVPEIPLKDFAIERQTDINFKRQIQKILVFCDILGLHVPNDKHIYLRSEIDGRIQPINRSESISNNPGLSWSILPKTVFLKWFGEETRMSDIAKEMLYLQSDIIEMNITIILADIRDKIDKIIKNYDIKYIWYSYFITDRLSRYLIADI